MYINTWLFKHDISDKRVTVTIIIREISVGLMLTLCCDIDLIRTTCEQGVDRGASTTILPVLQTAKYLNLALWTHLLVSLIKKEGTLCQTGNPDVCRKPESWTRRYVHRVETDWDRAKGVCVKYGFNLEQGKKIIKSSLIICRMASKKTPNDCRGFA